MRAVIFDLDGTLIDASADLTAKLNHVLVAEGLAPLTLEQVCGMIGDGAQKLVERGFAARGRAMAPHHLDAFMALYPQAQGANTKIYEGVLPALETLRAQGRKLGLCTNKPEIATHAVLDDLALTPFFDAVVAGDSTPYRKPDPRHLAATLAALEVTDAIMVGDHVNDMSAAAALGVPAVFCAWGHGEGVGDARAETPAALPDIIARLG